MEHLCYSVSFGLQEVLYRVPSTYYHLCMTHQGAVCVISRDFYFYILYFERMDDLHHVCNKGQWSVDGMLFVLEKWRPNLVLGRLQLNYVSLWIQLYGLPLEYQYPKLTKRMGQMTGIFERVDLDDNLPRNIWFLRIRMRMDPWSPLMTGFMLHLDDVARVWVQCRYERIHKICKRCGLIGQTRNQCTYSMDDIEMSLFRQWVRIQNIHQVQFRYKSLEPHFTNELRAFSTNKRAWTSQLRFGILYHQHYPASFTTHQIHLS